MHYSYLGAKNLRKFRCLFVSDDFIFPIKNDFIKYLKNIKETK